MNYKDWLRWLGITVGLILIGVWIDRAFLIKETVVEVPTQVNLQEIKDKWLLEVKKSYISGDSAYKLLERIKYLNKDITLLVAKKNQVIHDTLFVGNDGDTPIYSTSLDTPLIARVYVVQGEDTLRREQDVRATFDIQFYDIPDNPVFNLERFSLTPFTVQIPVKERFVDDSNNFGLWIDSGTRGSLGLSLQYSFLKVGYERNFTDGYSQLTFDYRLVGF